MDASAWFLAAGLILTVMALAGAAVRRLPLSSSMLYLAAGVALGPVGLGLFAPDPLRHAAVLEHLTEVVVIISLFVAGLKMRVPLSDWRWVLPARLAFGSMAITVGLITLVGVYGLGLPLGAAVLLGAILAPTDPVLASDVQVTDPTDRDRLRFGLTGEAGLNDGTAFPFIMLGLGLLGLHDLGAYGWKWVVVDLVWAVGAGLGVGWVLGAGVSRLVLAMRRRREETVGMDDYLTLGLIALAYGAALLVHAYGFLAVFAAGLALRRVEMRATGDRAPADLRAEPVDDPAAAPAHMADAVLGFTEQLERIGEVLVVVVLGAMLSAAVLGPEAAWFLPVLFLLVRPLAVYVGLAGSPTGRVQRRLTAWFGIRGAGSVYYLMFAITHGLPADLAEPLTRLTLAAVAVSVVVHGISVTPLMGWYGRRKEKHLRARPAAVGPMERAV